MPYSPAVNPVAFSHSPAPLQHLSAFYGQSLPALSTALGSEIPPKLLALKVRVYVSAVVLLPLSNDLEPKSAQFQLTLEVSSQYNPMALESLTRTVLLDFCTSHELDFLSSTFRFSLVEHELTRLILCSFCFISKISLI